MKEINSLKKNIENNQPSNLEAEQALLGSILKPYRHELIIATKAGLKDFGSPPDFNAAAVEASVGKSLRHFQSDYIDILQLHNPSAYDLLENESLLKLLEQMRRDGKIRAVGLSLKSPCEALPLTQLVQPDTLQMNLNLLDHRAIEDGILDWALAEGIGVIARTPLCFGFLSGEINDQSTFSPNESTT